MPRQGRFNKVVGLFTIAGTIISGVALALYAVDNEWVDEVQEWRVALRTGQIFETGATDARLPPPLPSFNDRKSSDQTDTSAMDKPKSRSSSTKRATSKRRTVKRRTSPSKRRARAATSSRKTTSARRKLDSNFASAKFTPYPDIVKQSLPN